MEEKRSDVSDCADWRTMLLFGRQAGVHETESDRPVDLCERIRAYCARSGWYGPDMLIGLHPPVPWPRNPMRDFPYPPATDDQIALTEQELGFALPPLLRALYQQLGNGGFGPGNGVIGVSGGYVACSSPEHDFAYEGIQNPTLAMTLSRNRWRIPTRDLARLLRHPGAYVSEVPQPGMTVSLIQWGCNVYTLLDCDSGLVYGYFERMLQVSATSLDEWLEGRMAGTLDQPSFPGEAEQM